MKTYKYVLVTSEHMSDLMTQVNQLGKDGYSIAVIDLEHMQVIMELGVIH